MSNVSEHGFRSYGATCSSQVKRFLSSCRTPNIYSVFHTCIIQSVSPEIQQLQPPAAPSITPHPAPVWRNKSPPAHSLTGLPIDYRAGPGKMEFLQPGQRLIRWILEERSAETKRRNHLNVRPRCSKTALKCHHRNTTTAERREKQTFRVPSADSLPVLKPNKTQSEDFKPSQSGWSSVAVSTSRPEPQDEEHQSATFLNT